jgi:Fe-S-cluster containining protein
MAGPPVQQFGSQAVAKTLGRGTDVDACMALTTQVNQLLEQATTHLQDNGAALACRAGCNFCCHLRVLVRPHEAIALFRYLQSRMPATLATRVRAKLLEYTQPSSAGDTPPALRACAFLVEGRCAAYEVRPGACAAYHSLSKERCEESFRDPTLPSGTVALQALQLVAIALEEGVGTALQTEGLSNIPVELHTAVAALLRNPGLIARWRAGRRLSDTP